MKIEAVWEHLGDPIVANSDEWSWEEIRGWKEEEEEEEEGEEKEETGRKEQFKQKN